MVVGMPIVSRKAFSLDIIYIMSFWPPTLSTSNRIKIRYNIRIVSVVLSCVLIVIIIRIHTNTHTCPTELTLSDSQIPNFHTTVTRQ